jgi:hypothetical protein
MTHGDTPGLVAEGLHDRKIAAKVFRSLPPGIALSGDPASTGMRD